MDIPTGVNADYYQTGRLNARYYRIKPLPADPPRGTPQWWNNEGVKDVVGGFPSRTGLEATLNDEQGNPRPVQFGDGQQQGGQQGGGPFVRRAPVYVPRPGTGPGSGVYVPPPGVVRRTYEVYAQSRGRRVAWGEVTRLVGGVFKVDQGARVLVANRPNEGFGLAGEPGQWARYYPSTSPTNFGLDSDTGILGYDSNRKVYAVGATQLAELFGANWRAVVYH